MASLVIRRTKGTYSADCGRPFKVVIEITNAKGHSQKIDILFKIPGNKPCDFLDQNQRKIGKVTTKTRTVEPGWQKESFFIGLDCEPGQYNFPIEIVAVDEDGQPSNVELVTVEVTC